MSWSHFSKQKGKLKQLQYALEYSTGQRSRQNSELWYAIYKGKAHKCIITDLRPATQYKIRVAPQVRDFEGQEWRQGEWSDTIKVQTQEPMGFELNQIASVVKNRIHVEKAGLIFGRYFYEFGQHYWLLNLKPLAEVNQAQVSVGVISRSQHRVFGVSLVLRDVQTVKVLLDIP